MRKNLLLALVFTIPAVVFAAVQHLNVKTGLWEVTRTQTSSGQLPIPPGLMAKLSPEQRARLEARMKAQSGERSETTTEKHCLTEEQLEKGLSFGDDRKECTQTVVSSSSSQAEIQIVCEAQGMKGNGTLKVEALNPENVKGSSEITATGGSNTMNSSSTFTAKWLGQTCGEVQ